MSQPTTQKGIRQLVVWTDGSSGGWRGTGRDGGTGRRDGKAGREGGTGRHSQPQFHACMLHARALAARVRIVRGGITPRSDEATMRRRQLHHVSVIRQCPAGPPLRIGRSPDPPSRSFLTFHFPLSTFHFPLSSPGASWMPNGHVARAWAHHITKDTFPQMSIKDGKREAHDV